MQVLWHIIKQQVPVGSGLVQLLIFQGLDRGVSSSGIAFRLFYDEIVCEFEHEQGIVMSG